MAQAAPALPTLDDLTRRYPLRPVSVRHVKTVRQRISSVLTSSVPGFVGIGGPCALTINHVVINAEGGQLKRLEHNNQGLITLHRMPPWKPRSNPNDWHGSETEAETVEVSYEIIAERAAKTANVTIEIGQEAHLARYGSRLSFGWIGGRNIQNHDLVKATALAIPSLPIGIKNGLDGEIDQALQHVDLVEQLREADGAPAVLIYRGGENAKSHNDWEKSYRRALEITEGKMIVDTAHGGEMAHDPEQKFQKSVVGQIACLETVIRIAEEYGEMPLGIMIEASNAPSPTDPVIPFDVAINCILRLNTLKRLL